MKKPAKSKRNPAPTQVAPGVARAGLTEFVAYARAGGQRKERTKSAKEVFAAYKPPAGVLPPGASIAQDSDIPGYDFAAAGGFQYGEGQWFIGYPQLAILAQRAEYRLVVETVAKEMTRKWIEFKSATDDKGAADKIKAIETEFARLKVREKFRAMAEKDGYFGRGHLYFDFGVDHRANPDEDKTDIGHGSANDRVTKAKVKRASLKALRVIEPVWVYPQNYGTTDPTADNWYRPDAWFIMGRQVHSSRLLTFVGREVPDMLKPAYAFGGLSLAQMCMAYVNNWLTTRQSVADILQSFSQFVVMTNMKAVLQGGPAQDFYNRLDAFNATRDNRGILALDKDTEDFKNVSAPLSGLDVLQAQALEHIASVAQLPLVKLTGISPSGLNASSDGELRSFNDNIHSWQEVLFRDNLQTVMNMVQWSLYGEVDPGITFEFVPLYELTEKEVVELEKVKADTDAVYVDLGAISPEEVRQRLAADKDSPYDGIDPDDMPEPPQGGFEGEGDPRGETLDPNDPGDGTSTRGALSSLFDRAKQEKADDQDQSSRDDGREGGARG